MHHNYFSTSDPFLPKPSQPCSGNYTQKKKKTKTKTKKTSQVTIISHTQIKQSDFNINYQTKTKETEINPTTNSKKTKKNPHNPQR